MGHLLIFGLGYTAGGGGEKRIRDAMRECGAGQRKPVARVSRLWRPLPRFASAWSKATNVLSSVPPTAPGARSGARCLWRGFEGQAGLFYLSSHRVMATAGRRGDEATPTIAHRAMTQDAAPKPICMASTSARGYPIARHLRPGRSALDQCGRGKARRLTCPIRCSARPCHDYRQRQ